MGNAIDRFDVTKIRALSLSLQCPGVRTPGAKRRATADSLDHSDDICGEHEHEGDDAEEAEEVEGDEEGTGRARGEERLDRVVCHCRSARVGLERRKLGTAEDCAARLSRKRSCE
jgi:hypothetical protein